MTLALTLGDTVVVAVRELDELRDASKLRVTLRVGSLDRAILGDTDSVTVELREGSFERLALGDTELDVEGTKEFELDGVTESVLVPDAVTLDVPEGDMDGVTV